MYIRVHVRRREHVALAIAGKEAVGPARCETTPSHQASKAAFAPVPAFPGPGQVSGIRPWPVVQWLSGRHVARAMSTQGRSTRYSSPPGPLLSWGSTVIGGNERIELDGVARVRAYTLRNTGGRRGANGRRKGVRAREAVCPARTETYCLAQLDQVVRWKGVACRTRSPSPAPGVQGRLHRKGSSRWRAALVPLRRPGRQTESLFARVVLRLLAQW